MTPVPSTSTFSFKAPITLAPQSGTSPTQKQRRVSLALPSSPRLVPAWNFRDDTSVPYAPKGKMRRIDVTPDDEPGDEEEEGKATPHEDGDASTAAPSGAPEKKARRKWTPEETQMLVDGCNIHGVGNWKTILSDPSLTFANRSPVDLKDRFRTYFPEAYRTHYPNARTHLPPSLGRAASPLAVASSSVTANSTAVTSSSSVNPTHGIPAPPAKQPNRSTHPDGTPLFPLPSPAHPKRRPFTAEEDAALLAGFRRHGAAWAAIAKDAPVFGQTGRRSMDLRDRFRNAWPGEYERAGYKARPKVGKKKDKEKEQEKEKGMKTEGGDGEEVRGRARVGRSRTDEGLGRLAGASASAANAGGGGGAAGPSAEGGPVRRRRRAHTSQGFKTGSMPPSVVGSDDEGEPGPGGAPASDFGGLSFGRAGAAAAGSDFRFQFVAGNGNGKGEETALVGGMRHLDMAPDEAMPDAPATTAANSSVMDGTPAPPPPAPSKFQAHFLQHRRQEELGLGSSSGGTIGRSAWGTQDWLSANPRLDPTASAAFSLSLSPTLPGAALPTPQQQQQYPHSPPLSFAQSPVGTDTDTDRDRDTGGFFELAHGVMERYDLEPAALSLAHHHPQHAHLHLHHHHPAPGPNGQGAYPPHAFSSPALSFHSASLSLDHSHSYSHSLSEAGAHDFEYDPFDEDSSAFSIAESEPGWVGAAGGGMSGGSGGGGGGGFRGFTHHSNTAGDLIFGARTHQPIWSGVDAWGVPGRGRGLAGIAEARGGKRGEEGDGDADGDADAREADGGEDDKALNLFSLDDLVDLSQHESPDADMDMDGTGAGAGSMQMQVEPPGTPLLRASPAPARTLHVHHHHHHHHHYAATARSVSVPPGEGPEEGFGLGLGLGQLMSAPATPALGAAQLLSPPSAFALDPALLSLTSPGVAQHQHPHPHQSVVPSLPMNTLHSTLMGPPPTGVHGEALYNLPFLDLHYFGGSGGGVQQMQLDGWRGGEALDLARSSSSSSHNNAFPPSAFSFAPHGMAATQVPPPPPPPPPPPVAWKALGVPASLRQHIPSRPLMRSTSGGAPASVASGGGRLSGSERSTSHQRGQSAVVRPQDLSLTSEATSGGLKGKRKRASWDGGGW
ncbi:hypothetical protein B0H11DRAFT_2281130 [Mycena galericulata]|nr:hypothetical protein B0H11DRAFT_2281130 [Mycena galericulata]